MKKRLILSLLGITGLFAVLTQGNPYKASAIPSLFFKGESFSDSAQIQIAAKAYNREETEEILHSDLQKWGYQPIQITVDNQSSESYTISPKNISLNSVSPKDVAKVVIKASIPRSIGLKAAGFIFWPFMIPSTIEGIHTLRSYNAMKKDLRAKSVKDETVAPYSVFHRLVFVKKEQYQDSFDITLVNQETQQESIFHVQLTQENPQEPVQIVSAEKGVQENYYLNHGK